MYFVTACRLKEQLSSVCSLLDTHLRIFFFMLIGALGYNLAVRYLHQKCDFPTGFPHRIGEWAVTEPRAENGGRYLQEG